MTEEKQKGPYVPDEWEVREVLEGTEALARYEEYLSRFYSRLRELREIVGE